MKEELVTFKGVNEGVFVNIQGDDMEAIKEEVNRKMETSLSFYRGTNIIGIRSEKLPYKDMLEIKFMLKYKYDLSISEDIDFEIKPKDLKPEESMEGIFEGIDSGMTKFVNGTIRSGQVEIYTGNIVIIGDVNPGGLIQAKGNIIVLGSIRGLAHAGIGGNRKAIVAAYNLQPTQLRIADIIVRPPDEGAESYKLPEIAKIKNGKVIIEPYLPNK
ncbi:MAG TPA: septum site-determining protein MinC [Tissierellaceae bacterium]|nr:septum site-determining protein MinC [Tissierellaceae bacterium]